MDRLEKADSMAQHLHPSMASSFRSAWRKPSQAPPLMNVQIEIPKIVFTAPDPEEIENLIKDPKKIERKSLFEYDPEDFGLPPETPVSNLQQVAINPITITPAQKKNKKSNFFMESFLRNSKKGKSFKEEELDSGSSSEQSIQLNSKRVINLDKQHDKPIVQLKIPALTGKGRRSTMNHVNRSKEDIINMMKEPANIEKKEPAKNPEENPKKEIKETQDKKEEVKEPVKTQKGVSSSDSFSRAESSTHRKREIDKIIITVLPAIEEVGEQLAISESRVSSVKAPTDSPQNSKHDSEINSPTKTNAYSTTSNIPKKQLTGQQSNEDSKNSSQHNISLADKHSGSSSEYRQRVLNGGDTNTKPKRKSQYRKSKFNPEGKLE